MTGHRGRGLLDHAQFASCRDLPTYSDRFRRDLARLPDDRFVQLTDDMTYSGTWRVAPLVLRWSTPPAHLDPVPNQRCCVESFRILDADPRILGAGFSRLLPGSRIDRHVDRPQPGVLRFHLCLDGDEDATLEVDGIEVPIRAGRGIVFDHSLPHSARHDGSVPRNCLIVDFRPTASETAALVRQRGGVNLGPVAAPASS